MSNEKKYSYNGETDFLEWYRANEGSNFQKGATYTRPEDMDDATWAAVNRLYSSYQTDLQRQKYIDDATAKYNTGAKSVLQKYSSDKGMLDENKRVAQQNASIAYAKLLKYLPEQQNAAGLGSLGVSQTAQVDALNKYTNAMGGISADYSKNLTDLNTSKNETLATLERYKNQDISDINEKYDGYLRESGDKALDAYNTVREKEQERIENENNYVLETLVIPKLTELETAGDFGAAFSYLKKNKKYFTNDSEYKVMYDALKSKVKEKPSTLKGDSIKDPSDTVAYTIANSNPLDNSIKLTREFQTALAQKGLAGGSDIPNGTTIKIVVNGISEPFYATYTDGEWYQSTPQK